VRKCEPRDGAAEAAATTAESLANRARLNLLNSPRGNPLTVCTSRRRRSTSRFPSRDFNSIAGPNRARLHLLNSPSGTPLADLHEPSAKATSRFPSRAFFNRPGGGVAVPQPTRRIVYIDLIAWVDFVEHIE
jgi:hypothetical protein